MTTSDRASDTDGPEWAIDEDREDEGRHVARLADPENANAWIESDFVRPIAR